MDALKARTKWGRAKLGNGRIPAMAIAVPGGLLFGCVLALVAVWVGAAGPNPLLGWTVFTLCLTVPGAMLAWVLVLDRSTLQGAAEQPEESVESRWYLRAAAGAQTDVIMLAGVGVLVLTFVSAGIDLDPRLVLAGVIGVSFVSFAIRYQLLRRKG